MSKSFIPLCLTALVILASLIVTGCNGTAEAPPADSLATVEKEASTDFTDVIIDATPSMRGFAGGPRYQNFVTQRLANASVTNEGVEYHQLTTALPGGLQPVDEKMNAAQPAFYARGNTELSTALDSLNPNGLTVLVTDLYQSNADMNAVSQAITRQAFDEGLAMGLIASRFSFDGKVYDVGPDGLSFDFEGNRPLYTLVFGPPRSVSNYFEELRKPDDSDEYKFLLFSSQIVERSGQVRFHNSDSLENLVRVGPPMEETPLSSSQTSTRTLGLRIRDNNSTASLNARFDMDVLPHIRPLLGREALETRVTEVRKHDTKSDSYVTKFKGSSQATEALRARVVQGDSTGLQLQVRPVDLHPGSYAFNIVIEVQNWELPTWVSEWNLPPDEFQTPDGSKTANLYPFLQDLGSSLTSTSPPRVATLQAYIEKE